MTAEQPEEEAGKTEPKTYSQAAAIASTQVTQHPQEGAITIAQPTPETDLNAVKGDKKGKGKGKGYGECWHCGPVGASTERMPGIA